MCIRERERERVLLIPLVLKCTGMFYSFILCLDLPVYAFLINLCYIKRGYMYQYCPSMFDCGRGNKTETLLSSPGANYPALYQALGVSTILFA